MNILQLLALFAVPCLLGFLHVWIVHRTKQAAFGEGAEFVKRQVLPYLQNCSASAHRKAVALCRPNVTHETCKRSLSG